ncbi:MAG: hypothetical protein EOO46_16280 [Flavobacterium sp.]|nr:MAG: hypothetical protein EOO46_16280 [Flavobacterium sp.]
MEQLAIEVSGGKYGNFLQALANQHEFVKTQSWYTLAQWSSLTAYVLWIYTEDAQWDVVALCLYALYQQDEDHPLAKSMLQFLGLDHPPDVVAVFSSLQQSYN